MLMLINKSQCNRVVATALLLPKVKKSTTGWMFTAMDDQLWPVFVLRSGQYKTNTTHKVKSLAAFYLHFLWLSQKAFAIPLMRKYHTVKIIWSLSALLLNATESVWLVQFDHLTLVMPFTLVNVWWKLLQQAKLQLKMRPCFIITRRH